MKNKFYMKLELPMSEPTNTYDYLVHAAKKFGNRTAISDHEGKLTYLELFEQTERVRQELEKRNLIRPARMAIRFGNDRHFLIGLFAAIGAGFAVMPVFHELTTAEQEEQFIQGKINYLLAHTGEIPLTQTPYGLTQLSNSPDLESQLICEDPACIRFTSGTTGQSKGVLIGHRAIRERIDGAQQVLQLTEQDTIIWVLPMAYHFVVSLILYVREGSHIAVTGSLDASEILRVIAQERGTVLYASPVHLKLLAYAGLTEHETTSLRTVISTTTAISVQVCRKFEENFQIPVTQAYGIIEIGLPLINMDVAHSSPDSVGKAVKGYSAAILDDQGRILPNGTAGNLALRGPGMCAGYLNPVRPLEDVLENGWFMTGDYALQDHLGHIRVVGRKKSVINVGGNKVFPEEVEFVLEGHPYVKEARVYSSIHPLIGEIVAAEVVLNSPCDIEELIHHCRNQLTAFKIPQRIRIVDEIAHTGSGKIKR
jgi:long-chain acyl-CoA synthetase